MNRRRKTRAAVTSASRRLIRSSRDHLAVFQKASTTFHPSLPFISRIILISVRISVSDAVIRSTFRHIVAWPFASPAPQATARSAAPQGDSTVSGREIARRHTGLGGKPATEVCIALCRTGLAAAVPMVDVCRHDVDLPSSCVGRPLCWPLHNKLTLEPLPRS